MKRNIIAALLAFIVLLGGVSALAQIFGLGPYPGGSLKTVYHFSSEKEPNLGTFTLEILPEGDRFRVRTAYELLEKPEEIEKLDWLFVGLGYREKGKIDLTPLLALDKREVEPNKDFVLPGGARLQTQERRKIAGIDVVMAIYTHRDYPDQRVIIAISDLATRKLLVYPPLLQLEKLEKGEFKMLWKIELLEFSHNP